MYISGLTNDISSRSLQVHLTKRDDELLFQLRGIDVSISGLREVLRNQSVTPYCQCGLDIENESDDENVVADDTESESRKLDEAADLRVTCDIVGEKQTTTIGNLVLTPIARVISWLGESDFESAANNERRELFSDDVTAWSVRLRSKTCGDSVSESEYFTRAASELSYSNQLSILGYQTSKDFFCEDGECVGTPIDNKYRTMWRSDTSLEADAPFHWSRSSPGWRSFSMMDKLDNYLLNHVSRMKLQPRPRLHRQDSFGTDRFDVNLGGRSAKIFLSDAECQRPEPRKVMIPITIQRETPDERVPEQVKSDSGFDDSFEEIDRNVDGVKNCSQSERNLIRNYMLSVRQNVPRNKSSERDAECLANLATENLATENFATGNSSNGFTEANDSKTISVDAKLDNEVIAIPIQDAEHFITFHEGMVSCRIMSPNLERQISEQNDEDEDGFDFLSFEDGKVVFRSRERAIEPDDYPYYIGELYGDTTEEEPEDGTVADKTVECFDNQTVDSTDNESYCTAVTDFSYQREHQQSDDGDTITTGSVYTAGHVVTGARFSVNSDCNFRSDQLRDYERGKSSE